MLPCDVRTGVLVSVFRAASPMTPKAILPIDLELQCQYGMLNFEPILWSYYLGSSASLAAVPTTLPHRRVTLSTSPRIARNHSRTSASPPGNHLAIWEDPRRGLSSTSLVPIRILIPRSRNANLITYIPCIQRTLTIFPLAGPLLVTFPKPRLPRPYLAPVTPHN